MRTLTFIAAGLGLVVIGVALARWTGWRGSNVTTAVLAVWFAVAAANLWIGVSQAGYSFLEELPIFLVIFLIPAAAAVAARGWLPR